MQDVASCAGRDLPCAAYCAVKVGCTGSLRGWTLKQAVDCVIACPAEGQRRCGGLCVDTQSDVNHCSECGRACAAGETCVAGACTPPAAGPCAKDGTPCGDDNTCCGGACIDTRADLAHCGGCGAPCGEDHSCCGGKCTNVHDSSNCGGCGIACGAGDACCLGGCTATSSDPLHCGGCGKPCGKGELCCAGKCAADEAATGCACATTADCAPLDDGDKCNGIIACTGGTCVLDKSGVVPCAADSAGPCMTAACNPVTGSCDAGPKANDTACDDGDACTKSDSCQAGTCTGMELAPACQCAHDGDCDDDNACNGAETCVADGPGKSCKSGTPVTCPPDPAQPCAVPQCDSATGACGSVSAVNGSPCTVLGGPCGGKASCDFGKCVGVSAASCGECTSDQQCPTSDACDGAWSCVGGPDGGKHCQQSATPQVTCEPGKTCNPATGSCE